MDQLKKLLEYGVLGFYDRVEITEIFAHLPDKTICNIFTIIVAENRLDEKIASPKLINNKRLVVSKLKDWSFGILSYTKNINDILLNIKELKEEGSWSASGNMLKLEDQFQYQPPKFVPPDSFEEVPLNKVLKNNFWNGSHIVELQNSTKNKVIPFLESPELLQELSEKIQQYIPIALASLSDRLGNFLIQIPVTVIQAQFQHSKSENDLRLKIAFHPKAKNRKLRVNCEMEYDKIINGYGSYEIKGTDLVIPMDSDYGPHKGVVWDDEHNLILAATRPSSFVSTFSVEIGIIENEPRVFKIKNKDIEENIRINVRHTQRNDVGDKSYNHDGWVQKRLYRDEKTRLTKQKKFIQYKPKAGDVESEHQKAISDIKSLIVQYGEKGVWLWDPYLNANDILKTLFYCPYFGSDLRALTNLSAFNDKCETKEKAKGKNALLVEQKKIFQNLDSNFYGIKFEFRARIGSSGWNFHDRFLIFPDTREGVLAWSLGTSVNSLGKQHHILQKIDDGQLIADSFIELWEQLDHQDNLIWKHQ
ncbi:VPA1262 family N-terminal domain-containing protein [Halomonas sp. HL-93]|uniref:VPA1262 family N-terminal domain-containing protein n=1 Tax=Halomonas sp. HL-93 TaxID=1666906 RepID=UPI0006DA95FE|nr:VPA1262 family N-terminal domain-containing protein [Halomonas sp. HL-93]KPQ19870.1 MAG: hypothetical protein HLUCCO06_12690 [Halomonas sp. HL-93]SBR48107.1 hypothetical protein GA0071314_1533 [Halomonas sp. HL-93]